MSIWPEFYSHPELFGLVICGKRDFVVPLKEEQYNQARTAIAEVAGLKQQRDELQAKYDALLIEAKKADHLLNDLRSSTGQLVLREAIAKAKGVV